MTSEYQETTLLRQAPIIYIYETKKYPEGRNGSFRVFHFIAISSV